MAEIKNTPKKKSDRFYKSRKDRMIDGVCAGLADYFGVDATLVRVLWFLSVLVHGVGLVAYILAMIIVPINPEHKDLKEGEKKKGNVALIVGLVLILIGIFSVYSEWDFDYRWDFPFHFRHFPFWTVPWAVVWPLGLVALGVAYIVFVLNREKGDTKETQGKSQKGNGGQKTAKTGTWAPFQTFVTLSLAHIGQCLTCKMT